jgi:hypothetical protein
VETADDSIGLGIKNIEKNGDEFTVHLSYKNDIINNSPENITYADTLITFYDPQDYTHTYQAFDKDEEGKIVFHFKAGDSLSRMDYVHVNFPTPSKVVYMYFAGAPDVPNLYTVPMFYTLILDDDPRVFEPQPRAANGIFD